MGQAAFHRILAQSRVDGAANTTGVAASILHARDVITLPNGYFREGRQLRLTAKGRISCAVTTPGTAHFDIRITPQSARCGRNRFPTPSVDFATAPALDV